jgi:hypothetical protein
MRDNGDMNSAHRPADGSYNGSLRAKTVKLVILGGALHLVVLAMACPACRYSKYFKIF